MLETCLSATEAYLLQNYETISFLAEVNRTNLINFFLIYLIVDNQHKEAANILVIEIQKKKK